MASLVFLVVATLLRLDICEVSSYAVSHTHKFPAPEHLPGDEPKYTHTETVSGAPRPVRLPNRETEGMEKGQVVIQGICNEDIG